MPSKHALAKLAARLESLEAQHRATEESAAVIDEREFLQNLTDEELEVMAMSLGLDALVAERIAAGHYAGEIKPKAWPRLAEGEVYDELSDRLGRLPPRPEFASAADDIRHDLFERIGRLSARPD